MEGEKAEYYAERAHAAERAAAPRDIGFMQRRKEDAATKLRDIERKIARRDTYPDTPEHAAWLVRLDALHAEHTEEIAYWSAQIEAAGGIPYSKETVKKGDLFHRRRGGWGTTVWQVVRANPKTVSAVSAHTPFPLSIPYAEIAAIVGHSDT